MLNNSRTKLLLFVGICSILFSMCTSITLDQQTFDRIENQIQTDRDTSSRTFAEADRMATEKASALAAQTNGNHHSDFFDLQDLANFAEASLELTRQAGVDPASFNADGTLSNNVILRERRPTRKPATCGRLVRCPPEARPRTDGCPDVPIDGPSAEEVKRFTPRSCPWRFINATRCNSTTKYRTVGGQCNNLINKPWGSVFSPFTRVLEAKYEKCTLDGVRKSNFFRDGALPHPRKVSTSVTRARNLRDSSGLSAQVMQWGQYIAHEVTSIAEQKDGKANIACCPDLVASSRIHGDRPRKPTASEIASARSSIRTDKLKSDACNVIEVENDQEFGEDYVCIHQARSNPTPSLSCLASSRLQMNTATSFVDGGAIYGSSTNHSKLLREFSEELSKRGKVKAQIWQNKELLPREDVNCVGIKCPFAAGDGRVNTTPNLASVHTLFIRKHNQIAGELAQSNPSWNDEKVFQETRRIIIAIQQNIHFNEWLQVVLPEAALRKYGLKKSATTGFHNVYNSTLNPGTLNELAGAALRFGHTTVNSLFTIDNIQENLTNHFDNPSLVYNVGISHCLAGLKVDAPSKFDHVFSKSMRNELLKEKSDIVSLNINRGRDHGYDSYANYREHYKLPVANTWDEMSSTHDQAVIDALKSVYSREENVELYVGGVTERPLQGGYVGPLFAEILGDGFSRLKKGDRFYFEGQQSGFTTAQINTIRTYSYSKLICDVGDVNKMPPNAFRRPGTGNPDTICNRLSALDVGLFNDKPDCSWKVLSSSDCCSGQRVTTRQCEGKSHCRPGSRGCDGPPELTSSCTCSGWRCGRNCPARDTQPAKPTRDQMCSGLDDLMCDFMMEAMETMGDEMGDCHDFMCLMALVAGKK